MQNIFYINNAINMPNDKIYYLNISLFVINDIVSHKALV